MLDAAGERPAHAAVAQEQVPTPQRDGAIARFVSFVLVSPHRLGVAAQVENPFHSYIKKHPDIEAILTRCDATAAAAAADGVGGLGCVELELCQCRFNGKV